MNGPVETLCLVFLALGITSLRRLDSSEDLRMTGLVALERTLAMGTKAYQDNNGDKKDKTNDQGQE